MQDMHTLQERSVATDILLNSSLLGWDKTADVIIDLVERRYDIDEEALKKEA